MRFVVALWVILGGAVVVALVMSFFVRRHGESATPKGGWRPTDEVFIDATSNRRMRVWVDPGDGSRHYVPERTPSGQRRQGLSP